MTDGLGQLPTEPLDRFTKPLQWFLRIEAAAGAVLLFCTLVALVLSNSFLSAPFLSFWEMPAEFRLGSFQLARSLKHWINDGLMTLFFFLIALELKREIVLGELRNPRMAALSLAAALGGMVVPVGFYLWLKGGGPGAGGWGAVMATDTAFVIGCLALLGSRIPQSLRLFILSLAIFDDVGAILVVTIGYGGTLNWIAIGVAGLGLAGVAGIARLGVRSMLIYFAMGGSIWLAMDASGIHPTIVGVILGLMTPARSWVSDNRLRAILDRVTSYDPGDHWSGDTRGRQDLRRAGVAAREALSPVERLELVLHPWVAFAVLPLFALANAGIPISRADIDGTVVTAIFVGFVFGKPIGIVLFSFLAVSLGWATRPSELPWSILAAGGLLTGIGFTMALFIAELAFDSTLISSAKFGILGASAVSAAGGLLALAWLTTPGKRLHGSSPPTRPVAAARAVQ
jgi:Na+:H+ antiporter, NhaA family